MKKSFSIFIAALLILTMTFSLPVTSFATDSVPEPQEVTESTDVPETDTTDSTEPASSTVDENGRTIEVTTSDTDITVNETSNEMNPVGSEDRADGKPKEDLKADTNKQKYYHYDADAEGTMEPDDKTEWENQPENGDYAHVGWAEYSAGYVTVLKVNYEKDENGNILYDENGDPVIKEFIKPWDDKVLVDKNGNNITEADVEKTKTGSIPVMYWLKDKEGNLVSVYCVDLETNSVDGHWYTVMNLEDSEYYTEEDAAKIRAIVNNGYWGTQEGTGSLETLLEKIKNSLSNGELEDSVVSTTTDENGNTVDTKVSDIIGGLTEGEALDCTQAAIWMYAHNYTTDDVTYLGAIQRTGYTNWIFIDDESQARRDAVFSWFMNLEGQAPDQIVINEKNFIENVNVKANKLIKSSEDGNSDLYDIDLTFELASDVTEKDNLVLVITYTDDNGKQQTITKRIAGKNAEGENYEYLTPVNGVYTIPGLQLTENEANTVTMQITGEQYLQQNAYFYAPVNGRFDTQSMVGLADGIHTIDIMMSMDLSFNITEPTIPDDEYLIEEDEETEGELPDDQYLVEEDNETQTAEETTVTTATDSSAQTGDTTNMSVYGMLMIAGLIMMAGTVLTARRKTE